MFDVAITGIKVSKVMENRTDGAKGEDIISHVTPGTCQQSHAPNQEYAKRRTAMIPLHVLT